MKATIAKMVRLARLKLPEQEFERFADKADHIVKYIEQLKEVDTSKLEGTSHGLAGGKAFREDQVEPFADVAALLNIAPDHDQNLFRVPKVIE